ncbi:phosphatase PAP2 family protein [Dactylosporangium aurantiacum]|uniref:Phosphatase PAP2 family protein n=1 Tax=Dactylosporangium aurantiacum TaxID=35754 RepID=A0A9Q9IMQ6_9ACTN|nr:phosphatase PAP2 family protein [Dactylosporangium aurantiacum]UWZ58491.1 phosphatase PAP2 family protein [Dactylosporangium aurantiacum]
MLLLALVRGAWGPLEAFDRSVASGLNAQVAREDLTVAVLRAVGGFGGRTALLLVLLVGTAYLLIRRQPRLAAYVVVTAGGAFMLDPVVKLLVQRLRPVVDVPVAAAPGPSFPSGHALTSVVSYGVLLLVFLPTLPRRWRNWAFAVTGGLVVLIGFTRMALGVHYLTDVLAGWALGTVWLAVTAAAFRTWRRETGHGAAPITDGLAPEAAAQLVASPAHHDNPPPHAALKAAELVVAWVLVVGVLAGVGVLVTTVLADSAAFAFDLDLVRWLAAHRTPAFSAASKVGSALGSTHWIIAGTLAGAGLALGVFRRWRPVLFLTAVMAGEITVFLTVATVVHRARPAVQPLNPNLPPTASFPSGHVAGILCLTLAIAVLTWHSTWRTWRYTAIIATALLPAAVALSRLYRGVHHPTDILGSVLLAVLWVTASWWIIRPTADRPAARARRSAPGAREDAPHSAKNPVAIR